MRDLALQDTPSKCITALRSDIKYSQYYERGKFPLAILTFADASKTEDKGQTGVLSGLLIGTLSSRYVFYSAHIALKRTERAVKSVESADVL